MPRDNNRFMIGATTIEAEDDGVSVRSALELLSAAYAVHPAFAEARIVEIGAGLRPAFPDNLPRIRIDGDHISVNGLYRHGFLLAPALAELTAAYLHARRHRQRGDAMRLTVNGEQKDVAATRVDALLGELEFEGTHFAIAVNYDVVPRGTLGGDCARRRRHGGNPHAAAGRLTRCSPSTTSNSPRAC